jgi:hypothetical protein
MKFPIVERPEMQSGIHSIENGFIPAHLSLDSTRMNKKINEKVIGAENGLPREIHDTVYLIRFICLCLVMVIFFVWS